MIPKIQNFCNLHQHKIFVSLCMVLGLGIWYNIGRIAAQNSPQQSQYPDARESPKINLGETSATRPLQTTVPKDRRVVASRASKSKLYHFSWCSGAQRIKETNKLWFESAAMAEAAGYSLAGNCQ